MKRIIFLLGMLLCFVSLSEAATRTIANSGGNWSANGTWVEGVAPTASDDVVATGTSGNVTIDTTTCVCKTMILTNYVRTMTFSSTLSVSGNVTFSSGMNLSGSAGLLSLIASATITMNGKTLPCNFGFAATNLTLVEPLNIVGFFWPNAGTVNLIGAYNITCGTFELGFAGVARTLNLVAGTTLTVTTNLYLGNSWVGSTIKSATTSSPAYLVYQGTYANSNIARIVFTDIDASGSVIPLYNYQGSALTRTVNIYNLILPPVSGGKIY